LAGLALRMPLLAGVFLVVTLAALGLPGLNSFVGEFMILLGAWQLAPVYAVVACLGLILAPVYMLRLFQGAMYGDRAGGPEVARLVAIVLDLVLPPGARGAASALVASLGLLVALALAAAYWFRWLPGGGKSAYSGFATGDGFALFFEALFAVLGVFTIAIARS